MNWKLALTSLMASSGTGFFACAQTCPPKPVPIRNIKFHELDSQGLHGYELRGNARIVEPAPDGIPRALRIDQVYSHALIKGLDISPASMPDVTLSISVYIESIRPCSGCTVPTQNESYGWVISHDNGGWDRAIFLHDERFNGMGMTSGQAPKSKFALTPTLQQWIHIVGVWRQGGECVLYIENEKVPFTQKVIGRNNPGRPDVAIGAPQLRSYGKGNDNDFWIKDVKIFDYALSDQEIEDLNCHFEQTLEPTIDCGQGDSPVFSCTECVSGDGSASGCAGDCMWRPEIPHCVEKGDSTDNIVDEVVSCGDHDAADCSQCDVSEDGSSGCSGDCKFADGECRPFEYEPPVDCGTHEAAACGECPNGEGASGCAGDCVWDPSLGECTEDNGDDSVISCGDHNAADCSQCDVSEDGSSGCTGQCKFAGGECRPFDWEPPVDVCAAAGLKASYFTFSSTTLPAAGLLKTYTPYKTDTVSKIDFNNGTGNFATSGRSDNVAATFEGSLLFEKAGTHKLCISHDDGVKVFVDGKLVINGPFGHTREHCASISVTSANTMKKVLVEYFEHGGAAYCQLKWTKPGSTAKAVIPASAWVKKVC